MPSGSLVAFIAASSALAIMGVASEAAPDDLFSLTARVEGRQEDGSWKTVAPPVPFGQAGPIDSADRGQRVVVHNRAFSERDVTIEISYYNEGTVQVLQEVWTLGPRAERVLDFTIPDAAYRSSSSEGHSVREGVLVYVTVDELRMSLNVMRGSGR